MIDTLLSLKKYCEAEDFAGWDPYDGLNSRLFKALPFVGRSAIMRLVWIQLFKRNPVNLRRLLLVPKQRNAKGIGLFLRGYCALWRTANANVAFAEKIGGREAIFSQIKCLADWLVDNISPGFSGAAWGYNFPWQCRREFLFPAYEPTVVATYFCAGALLDAYEIVGDERYRSVALSSAEFIKNDLRRTPYGGGVIISYSKMPGNDTIFNASLLGSALLARSYSYTCDKDALGLAAQSVEACCSAQRADGSWTYGVKPVTGWIDSFHTGYNLMALAEYERFTGDCRYRECVERGLKYYVDNFFQGDGAPKYYNDKQYPIDIHCVGQLFVTMSVLNVVSQFNELTSRVFDWTLRNMWDSQGYFYYQLKQGVSSKISYMRWSNAFMFSALTTILEKSIGVVIKKK